MGWKDELSQYKQPPQSSWKNDLAGYKASTAVAEPEKDWTKEPTIPVDPTGQSWITQQQAGAEPSSIGQPTIPQVPMEPVSQQIGGLGTKAQEKIAGYLPSAKELGVVGKTFLDTIRWDTPSDAGFNDPSMFPEGQEYWNNEVGEILDRARWVRTYVISMGGRLGPKTMKRELKEHAAKFSGLGPVTVPATTQTAQLALEWGWLYPQMFKAAGLTTESIKRIPQVAKALKTLEASGGLSKVAAKFPRAYTVVKSAGGAFVKGEMVGQTLGLAETLGKDMDPADILWHMNKQGAQFGVIASVFSVVSSADQAIAIKRLRNQMLSRGLQQVRQMSQGVVGTPGGKGKMKSLKTFEDAMVKYVDNVVAAYEAELTGAVKGELYKNIRGKAPRAQQAINDFLQKGYSPELESFAGKSPLKTGMGERPPVDVLRGEPTTRAGEVVKAAGEAVRHPVKGIQQAVKEAGLVRPRPSAEAVLPKGKAVLPVVPTEAPAVEQPIKAEEQGVKPTKAQRQHKTAVEQLFKKGKPVRQQYRDMYPDLVAKYEAAKGKEKIITAVVKIGEQTFEGTTHAEAVQKAVDAGVAEWTDEGILKKIGEPGAEIASDLFKTSTGQIVDRIGASKISGGKMFAEAIKTIKPAPAEAAKEAKGFTPDPTIQTVAAGEAGFAGVADRPGGKAQKPWLDLKKTESPDKQIEDFFGRTKKMPSVRKASKLLQKIKAGLRERFIFAHHLPDTPEAAVARDRIRTMPEERRAAGEKAIRDLVAILDGDGTVKALDNAGLDLLRRKVFTQDLLYEAEIDRSIAGDLSLDNLKAENARLDELISKVPSVKKAYEARQKLWDNISKDLYDRGVISEEARENPAYVRHFVLDYIDNNRRPVSSRKKKLSEPYRAYGKKRIGSRRDISTDYLEVEVRAMADIYRDNAVEDMANAIAKRYNKRAEFTKIAKAEDATVEVVASEQGYVEWHYKRPNLFYHALTLSESKIAALIENTAEQAGDVLQIPRSVMRDALVVGRRKGWIIPEWLATQLDDLPVNQRSNMVVRSFTKPFVQWWKRWILRVNPFRYNARNQLGDTERLNAAGQAMAIKKIPEGIKLLITKKGKLYEQMKKYGVAGSSLWHEMNDVKKVREFERFKNISKQKTFKSAVKAVFGAPIKLVSRTGQLEQDLTQFREDILRAAVYLYNLEKLEAGKPVRHWAGRIADIEAIAKDSIPRAAAKISRETLIDYGSFTPFENDVFRNGLLPFYSFFKRNFTFWPRAIRSAAKEGAAGKPVVAGATIAGFSIAKWLVRVMWAYAIAYLWNHRDDEAEKKEGALAFWLRAQPHINIGKLTVWGQTALNDFMEWIDFESLAGVNWRREAGFLSNKEAGIEAARIIAQGPVNKVYQALNPFIKGVQTAITGQVTWPSVFEPYFVATPASRKSVERAIVGILGTDANRFYQSAKGDRAFEDTLYAYFAAWWGKPTDPVTLAEQIQKTKEWSTLKRKSKTTGRKKGQAKKGKEAGWQEAQIRGKALKGQR